MILWPDLLDIHLLCCFKRVSFKDFSPTYFKIKRIHLPPAKSNRTADPRVRLLRYHCSHTHKKAFLNLFPLLSFNCSGRDCNPTAYFSFSQHPSTLGNHMHIDSTSLPALRVCAGAFPGPSQRLDREGAPAAARHPGVVGITHFGTPQNKLSQKKVNAF